MFYTAFYIFFFYFSFLLVNIANIVNILILIHPIQVFIYTILLHIPLSISTFHFILNLEF